MKFLKNIVAIVALLAIGSAHAKIMKRATTTTTYPTQPVINPTNPIVQPVVVQPIVQPQVGPTAKTPVFYDETTAMIKQDYLNNKAIEALKSQKTEYKANLLLNGEFINPMINEWKRRKFENIKSMETILREQIKDAVTEAKENPKVGPSHKTPKFYDEQTNMINQNYLKNEARAALEANNYRERKAEASLNKKFLEPIKKEWERRNLNINPEEIVKQIKNAVDEANRIPIPEEEKTTISDEEARKILLNQ